MRERFGERVRLVRIEPERSWLRHRLALGSAASEPAAWADALLDGVEALDRVRRGPLKEGNRYRGFGRYDF